MICAVKLLLHDYNIDLLPGNSMKRVPTLVSEECWILCDSRLHPLKLYATEAEHTYDGFMVRA